MFTFGSVPLKTYLPDGDIDLTAFSKNQNLKETWAHQVRDMLENEEKNEHAEFHVKEVQYIQAEVGPSCFITHKMFHIQEDLCQFWTFFFWFLTENMVQKVCLSFIF